MKSSFFKIFHYLVGISSVFTGVIVLSVLILSALPFHPETGTWMLYSIVSTVIAIITFAFSRVIFSIPFDLAVKFDPIKNDIASGKLSDTEEAQKIIGEFTVDFFNYVGADVVGGKILFEGSGSATVIDCDINLDDLNQDEIKRSGKVRIDKEHKAFYVPVVFEEKELGYLILITKGFTYPFFLQILEYFEDFFLDDQVMCLVRRKG